VVGGDVDEGMLVFRGSGLVLVVGTCWSSGGWKGCRGLLGRYDAVEVEVDVGRGVDGRGCG